MGNELLSYISCYHGEKVALRLMITMKVHCIYCMIKHNYCYKLKGMLNGTKDDRRIKELMKEWMKFKRVIEWMTKMIFI